MALKNAFANLVTEGIAIRLNYIVAALKNFSLSVDMPTGRVRATVENSVTIGTLPTLGTVTTVTGVTTVTTVTTVSTVSTVATLTNQAQLGGLGANSLVVDSMNNRWATVVRGRIT